MRKSLFIAAICLVFTATARGQHHHDPGEVDLGKLGAVTFKTTCSGAVQKEFSRAVAMMHSFWYAEAAKAFGRVASADPRCAMAHWGVAMSNYHPIWAPPSPDEMRVGKAAAENAKSIKAGSERERDFIDAINTFYAGPADHATRAKAYEMAMDRVAAKYPKDDEAAIFHALAILGTASPNDKSYANQKRAAAILTRILARHPDHPGVAHYIIHSYDYPDLAPLALDAARAYAKIAPGSPHALHMPSHIFTRLGLWDESITSNIASAEKARAYIAQIKPGIASFDELHAVDYLVYAYLQQGDEEKARALLERMNQIGEGALDLPNFAAAYALAAVPARFALERRKWDEAARLTLKPASFPWQNFPYAEANTHFARAVGAARTGDLNTAKVAVDRLAAIRKTLVERKDNYWADQVEIQRLSASAWLANAAGFTDEGLRLIRSAADLEDRTEKHPDDRRREARRTDASLPRCRCGRFGLQVPAPPAARRERDRGLLPFELFDRFVERRVVP